MGDWTFRVLAEQKNKAMLVGVARERVHEKMEKELLYTLAKSLGSFSSFQVKVGLLILIIDIYTQTLLSSLGYVYLRTLL